MFTLFIALGSGCFMFVAVLELAGKANEIRRIGTIVALSALILGGVASVLHLEHPLRALNVISNLGSPLGMELVFIASTIIVVLIFLFAQRAEATIFTKVLAVLGIILGAGLMLAAGFSYVLSARPAWSTGFLPLSYLVSAFVLGIFMGYTLLAAKKGDEGLLKNVKWAALILLGLQAAVTILYAASLGTISNYEPPAGDVTMLFWGVVILVGIVLPIIVALIPGLAKKTPLIVAGTGLVCVLAGGLAARAIMYIIGTVPPLPF